MTEKMLLEYVDRMGLVTSQAFFQQIGTSWEDWSIPLLSLIQKRDVMVCRLAHGEETLLSRHAVYCLRSVYAEPQFSEMEQNTYDWLSDNELSGLATIQKALRVEEDRLLESMRELQRKLCITPLVARFAPEHPGPKGQRELGEMVDFLWVTNEYWLCGIEKPARYNNLSYCVSEVRRLLDGVFGSKAINDLIYKGIL